MCKGRHANGVLLPVCARPLRCGTLISMNNEMTPGVAATGDTVATARALADENRVRALGALLEVDELCACHIIALLELAPATVSRHMGLLVDAGLVSSRREGKWVHYRCAESISPALRQWLIDSWSGSRQAHEDLVALGRIMECDRTELCACRRTGKAIVERSGARGVSEGAVND